MRYLLKIAMICLATLTSISLPGSVLAGTTTLVHIPHARLEPGQTEYLLHARFDGLWGGRGLDLMVRRPGQSGYFAVPFLAEGEERFVARLDGSWVNPPGLEYYIRSVEHAGAENARFASASTPHLVVVDPTRADQRRSARIVRHGGRQTEFSARFDHFNFGATRQRYDQAETGTKMRSLQDNYNSFEASIRYAFLQDAIYHISFGYGMLGGVMGTDSPPLEAWLAPNAAAEVKSEVRPLQPGLYYGFGTAYWEFQDAFALEAKVLMGASYRGFEGGAGVLGRIGTLRGTHFDVSIEGVSNVGYRFVTEFQWSTLPHFRMSLRNEVSTYPFGDTLGVLPSYNVTLELDDIELSGSLGYGARKGYEEGGFCAGAGIAFRL